MSDYKLINKKDLSRLSEAEVQALGETDNVVNETKKLIENYENLIKCLKDLPKRENEEMMVPLGKVAYMPGKLVNTNRVTMALGDSWFIETSTTHAQRVVQRRIKALEEHLDKLKEQKRLFEDRFDYTEQFKKEGVEFVEITEECTEEEYAMFKAQHQEHFTKSKSKEQKQQEEKMNLDDFFAKYNDDDDDDDGNEDKIKTRENNDGIDPDFEGGRIHEGYRSILSDFGIDCANIEFTNDVTCSVEEMHLEDNQVTSEESRTCEPHFLNLSGSDETSGDIAVSMDTPTSDSMDTPTSDSMDTPLSDSMDTPASDSMDTPTSDSMATPTSDNMDTPASDSMDTPPSDNMDTPASDSMDSLHSDSSELHLKHLDKGFSEDEGFKILLSKLGFSLDEISDTTISLTKEAPEFSDQSSSKVETKAESIQNTKKSVGMKKSVTWGDEMVANDEEAEDYEDEEEECKPETILLNFKHSQALPVSLKPCTGETDPNFTIKTPGDIYTKMYRPKSILKDSKEPFKTSEQKKPVAEVEVATKNPAKILRPAVSASVVERTFDNQLQNTDKLPSQSENSRRQVSKFKAQMARISQQAS